MEVIFTQYLGLLMACFQYDVDVFSNGWLYVPLMIPIIIYAIFFIFKWYILTMPVWLPVVLICRAILGKSTKPVSIKMKKG